jgi:hypothetical protein
MLLPMQNYPFQKGVAPMRRRAWKPAEKWSEPQDRTAAGDIDLSDERIPADLRTKVIAAVMRGGAFAQEVADDISDMLDEGRIDPATAAAVLRALRAGAAGTAQGGDGSGGDGPVEVSPFGWPTPVRPDTAPPPPSDANGFLYPPELKRRTASGLAKRGKLPLLTRLQRRCQLIEQGDFNVAPNMKAIEKQIEREFKLGLLAP